MEVLWAASTPLTAKAISDALEQKSLAVTTVLTVLSRLERKSMLTRRRDERAHAYQAAASREDHVAELMREALGTAGDRDAALVRFVGAASPQEADVLRRALRSLRRTAADRRATVPADRTPSTVTGGDRARAGPVRGGTDLAHPGPAGPQRSRVAPSGGRVAAVAGDRTRHGTCRHRRRAQLRVDAPLRLGHHRGVPVRRGSRVPGRGAVAVTIRTLAQRRRHRRLLDLVGTPLPALPGGLLLDSTTAMAYCLPGLRPRMVVTSAAVADLTPQAFAAVVVHERAHLNQRHDLVVLPFVAWQAALPFLPGARTARAAVALLVEALADDAARTQVGSQPLGEALRAVSMAGGPPGTSTAGPSPSVDIRLARLGA